MENWDFLLYEYKTRNHKSGKVPRHSLMYVRNSKHHLGSHGIIVTSQSARKD